MINEDIVSLVCSLRPEMLTPKNFGFFSEGVKSLFVPGSELMYYSPVATYDGSTIETNDVRELCEELYNVKKVWRRDVFTRLYRVSDIDEKILYPGSFVLSVTFKEYKGDHGKVHGWSVEDPDQFLPGFKGLKRNPIPDVFAFEPGGGALYVIQNSEYGFWHKLFIKKQQLDLPF